MYFAAKPRLKIRDVRLMLVSAGVMAALLAGASGDPIAIRASAGLAGGLLATLMYERLHRIVHPSPLALRLADAAVFVQVAALCGIVWHGPSLPLTASVDFLAFGLTIGSLIVRDWVRGIVADAA